MGRKNNRLNVVTFPGTGKPPACYDKASAEIKRLFNEIRDSAPPSHFRKSDDTLIEGLARAKYQARQDQANIEKHGAYCGAKINPAAISLEKQQKLIILFTRALRLSPQTRMDRKARSLQGEPVNGPKPWDEGEIDEA